MRRMIACGLAAALLLSGCSLRSVNGQYHGYRSREAYEMYHVESIDITNTTDEIARIADHDWKELIERLDQLSGESWGYGLNELGEDSYSAQFGIKQIDGIIQFSDPELEQSQQVFELIEQQTHVDLSAFINEGRALKEGESCQLIAGNYGLVMWNEWGGVETYIMRSGLILTDTIKEKWLKEICRQDLLISAVSKGDEKQIYELSSPTFIANRNCYYEGAIPLSNLQVFSENTGEISKIRMVVLQNDNDEAQVDRKDALTEEAFQPLLRVIDSLEPDTDVSQLSEDFLSVASNRRSKAKGKVGESVYEITATKTTQNMDLLEIVITF